MDSLFLLPRNASSLYVYWTISDQRKQMIETHFKNNWNELARYLRLYDVSFIDFKGHHANSYLDIRVNNDSDNWFIQDVSDHCNYCIDLGTKTLEGRFITWMRSNTVKTPPKEAPSAEGYQMSKLDAKPSNSNSNPSSNPSSNPKSKEVQLSNIEPEWLKQFTGYSIIEAKTS